MSAFSQLMAMISSAKIDVTALATLGIFFPFFVLFTLRALGGYRFRKREIRVYDEMSRLASQAAESDQALMVCMGSAQLGGKGTPEASISLTVFRHVCQSAARYDQPIWSTAGDPVLLSAAQTVLQQAQRIAGYPERYRAQHCTFYGPNPLAYASGSADENARRHPLANLVMGQMDAEGLWLVEETASRGTQQLGGTHDPAAAALLHVALGDPAVGEDYYAAGGYLGRISHLGSLAAQDLMRVLIVLSVGVGALLASLGYWV